MRQHSEMKRVGREAFIEAEKSEEGWRVRMSRGWME